MTDTPQDEKKSIITKEFVSGSGVQDGKMAALFTADELDIYVNKITGENYIFYGKKIDAALQKFEYDHKECRINVIMEDGREMDLGIRIQWLIRPYIKKAREIAFVRTKDGEALEGLMVPVTHINRENDEKQGA